MLIYSLTWHSKFWNLQLWVKIPPLFLTYQSNATELHIGYFGSGSILNVILNIQALGKY